MTVENPDEETKNALETAARDIRKLIAASRKRLAVSLQTVGSGPGSEADPTDNEHNWNQICTKATNIALEERLKKTGRMLDFLVVSNIDDATRIDDEIFDLFYEKADPSDVWTEVLNRTGSGASAADIEAYKRLPSDPLIGPACKNASCECEMLQVMGIHWCRYLQVIYLSNYSLTVTVTS